MTISSSASTTRLAASANSRLAMATRTSCRTSVDLISTPMQREASAWRGHKPWLAARATAISDSRGCRRSRTVTLRWPLLQPPSKGDGPAASRPFILRGSACDSFASPASHLQRQRLRRCAGMTDHCSCGLGKLHGRTSCNDDILHLFCPTGQMSVRSHSRSREFGKRLNFLTVSTVHGVVFALFVLRAGYSAAFSLNRWA
ncbi:hypothetical protein ABIE86_005571 [Bradyrhizobium diazoefficiens]